MWSLLTSPHTIAVSCIISLFFTSTRMIDIIEHPLASVFWPVFGGAIAGHLISSISHVNIRPHVAIAILALTTVGILARIKGYIPDRRGEPLFKLTYSSTYRLPSLSSLINRNRISYTAHDLLENTGPTVIVEETLTPDNIMDALNLAVGLDPSVIQERSSIRNALENSEFLHQVSGIFIHSAETGLVIIKGPNTQSKHVMSIRI